MCVYEYICICICICIYIYACVLTVYLFNMYVLKKICYIVFTYCVWGWNGLEI